MFLTKNSALRELLVLVELMLNENDESEKENKKILMAGAAPMQLEIYDKINQTIFGTGVSSDVDEQGICCYLLV